MMTMETFKPDGFIGRYGKQSWIDGNTEAVIVGSEQELRSYLSGVGFTRSYDFHLNPNRRESVEELSKDSTDYSGMIFDTLGGVSKESAELIGKVKEIDGEVKLGDKLNKYVPNFVKKLGATIPINGREQARIYKMKDGQYAAELHKDPGIKDYIDGDRLWNGDVTTLISGLGNAIKYHYIDPKISEYKGKANEWMDVLFGSVKEAA
jgi:hypothetical protein